MFAGEVLLPALADGIRSGCTHLVTVDDGVGLDNQEQGLPLLLCRPTMSWKMLWPRLRLFD